MYSIYVAGYPSLVGGADTELLHNIDLWRSHDVEVHLVPMFGCDPYIKSHCDKIGCVTHKYHPSIFKDKIVTSWCNGEFLDKLPEIVERGKPRAVIFFNCMTWTFSKEIVAHANGWIDLHGFVSNYQRGFLEPELTKHRTPVNVFEGYRPYFNPHNKSQQINFEYRKPDRWFAVGRISRDDAHKYPADMWHIFYKVCAPIPKKVMVLGFGPNAQSKCGTIPLGMDAQVWGPNSIPVAQVYRRLHAIIHKTGGSRESYCRIVPEAYAYGVPMIVEDDFAFPDLVDHGVTGFRCKSSDEMSFRASELAFDETRRKHIIEAAHRNLTNVIASDSRCWEPWHRVFQEYGTKK